jgi:hypothetical protein
VVVAPVRLVFVIWMLSAAITPGTVFVLTSAPTSVVAASLLRDVETEFVKLAKMRIASPVQTIAAAPWVMFASRVRAALRIAMARSVVKTVVVALAAVAGSATAGMTLALIKVPIVWK